MFNLITKKITSALSYIGKQKKVTVADIESLEQQLHEALIQADVPYDLVTSFCRGLKDKFEGLQIRKGLSGQEQIAKVMYDYFKGFFSCAEEKDLFSAASIMVLGLQGSGKTTSLAKIAHAIRQDSRKKKKNKKVLMASVDFYRPAAIDQLEIMSKKVGADFYRAQAKDPVLAATEIKNYSQEKKYDVLLLDTAGRLHVDDKMLEEVHQIVEKVKPDYSILVLDAMTGQESLTVARGFMKKAPFDGAILTKMDSDTRGGAAFSFNYALKKSIVLIGVGEKPSDWQRFLPDRMASRILGQGDIATLAEKVDEKIKKSEQDAMYSSFNRGDLSLQDFADQMSMMSRLGSMSSLMKYMPGAITGSVSDEQLLQGEKELKMFKAIISSMKPVERYSPGILNSSRLQRVAKGAGVVVGDIKRLLLRFEESKKYVKLLKRSGMLQQFFK